MRDISSLSQDFGKLLSYCLCQRQEANCGSTFLSYQGQPANNVRHFQRFVRLVSARQRVRYTPFEAHLPKRRQGKIWPGISVSAIHASLMAVVEWRLVFSLDLESISC